MASMADNKRNGACLTPTRRGFTLVELLVVIAIIGILVSLLLPAVQAAREAGRRATCQNKLKQLALGCLNHHDAHRHFPTGGWGHFWVGNSNRGFGKKQPGGWTFTVLPFIEQQSLYEIGRGLKSWPMSQAAVKQNSTPIAEFICPSRREVKVYPYAAGAEGLYSENGYSGNPPLKNKTDYAINFGDTNEVIWPYLTVWNYTEADNGGGTWPDPKTINGVSYMRSELNVKKITDGTSKTYLVGEKAMDANSYEGGDWGDDWTALTGQQDDMYRAAGCDFSSGSPQNCRTPGQDTPGLMNPTAFGSAHAGICYMTFCDGSIHAISYEIDPETHRRLCNRHDGQTIESNSY